MADPQPPQARPVDSINQLTACRRCRKQKLRCSREKPACKRCVDISAICTYPPPPDRKLLAAQRAQNAKARAQQAGPSGLSDRPPAAYDSRAISEDSSPTSRIQDHEPLAQPSTPLQDLSTPTTHVALELFEIYFQRLYHATLLFHKQTLISSYVAGNLPDFVALSVFSLAALFIPSQYEQLTERRANLQYGPGSVVSLSECGQHADQWARYSGQMALMNSDQPRLETIQACQNVALYWFAVGQVSRTDIHSHVAYRTCRLLGLQNSHASEDNVNTVESEIRRRCFWSCWATHCISQDNADFKLDCWEEALALPFPSDEDDFDRCNPLPKEMYGKDGAIVPLNPHDNGPRRSIMGELCKYFGIWWEIQRFVKRYGKEGPHDASERIALMLSLDRRLEDLYANMHPDFRFDGPISFSAPKSDPYRIFSLQCIYHLCACALHSSIVPVFSSSPSDPKISKKLVRSSAEESVKHSLCLADMATAFSAQGLDKSRPSGINGYAMFVAANLQFKSLGSQGKLRSHGIAHLYAAISIMEVLKANWKPLVGLWSNLETLFSVASIDISNLESSHRNDRQSSGARDLNPNIDQIASHKELPSCPNSSSNLYTYIGQSEPSNPNSKHSQNGTPASQTVSPVSGAGSGDNIPPASPSISTLPIHTSQAGPLSLPRVDMASNYASHGYIYNNKPQVSQQQQHPVQTPRYEARYSQPQPPSQNNVSSIQNYSPMAAVIGQNPPMAYQTQLPVVMEGLMGDGTNLWWDHTFEAIETDPFGFLLGGMHGGDGGGYYTPNGAGYP